LQRWKRMACSLPRCVCCPSCRSILGCPSCRSILPSHASVHTLHALHSSSPYRCTVKAASCCSVQGCLTQVLVQAWRVALQAAIAVAESQLTTLGVPTHNNSVFTFNEIAARGRHRFDLKLDLGLTSMAMLSSALAAAPWLPLVTALLGPGTTMAASVVYSRPGADVQARYQPLCCEEDISNA
jgi:hypothetical protein